jgi:deoxyribonuclease V
MNTSLFPDDRSTPSLLHAQELVRKKGILYDDYTDLATVGGVDQAFYKNCIISGIVVMDYEALEIIEEVHHQETVHYPYIPTFLSFREGPAIISAFSKLNHEPDILMVDGCGINHPRSAGLATHVGVVLDVPTIGVAKNILCGEGDEPIKIGEVNPLMFKAQQVGWLVKSCQRCRPIVVAPGHRVSMKGSLEITRNMLKGHKLPEPCFLAHNYVNRIKKTIKHN